MRSIIVPQVHALPSAMLSHFLCIDAAEGTYTNANGLSAACWLQLMAQMARGTSLMTALDTRCR